MSMESMTEELKVKVQCSSENSHLLQLVDFKTYNGALEVSNAESDMLQSTRFMNILQKVLDMIKFVHSSMSTLKVSICK